MRNGNLFTSKYVNLKKSAANVELTFVMLPKLFMFPPFRFRVVCKLFSQKFLFIIMENFEQDSKKEVKRYFWKGRRVTQKVYENRCRMQKVGKTIRSVFETKHHAANLKNDTNCNSQSVYYKNVGRRIVNLKVLAEQLFCTKCKSILSLTDIIDEKRFRLVSIFDVKCRKCLFIKQVATDKQHVILEKNQHC